VIFVIGFTDSFFAFLTMSRGKAFCSNRHCAVMFAWPHPSSQDKFRVRVWRHGGLCWPLGLQAGFFVNVHPFPLAGLRCTAVFAVKAVVPNPMLILVDLLTLFELKGS
jgi:hypothetical protein